MTLTSAYERDAIEGVGSPMNKDYVQCKAIMF